MVINEGETEPEVRLLKTPSVTNGQMATIV